LGRPIGAAGSYTALEGDFHGQLNQDSGLNLSLPDGSREQFSLAGRLISMTDRKGNQTTLGYDAGGRLNSIVDATGRALALNLNANGQVASISDAMGTVDSYSYGGRQELL